MHCYKEIKVQFRTNDSGTRILAVALRRFETQSECNLLFWCMFEFILVIWELSSLLYLSTQTIRKKHTELLNLQTLMKCIPISWLLTKVLQVVFVVVLYYMNCCIVTMM